MVHPTSAPIAYARDQGHVGLDIANGVMPSALLSKQGAMPALEDVLFGTRCTIAVDP